MGKYHRRDLPYLQKNIKSFFEAFLKEKNSKYAEYFLYSDDLISKSTGVYTLQDAQDFIVIIDDITKKLETVFKNADLGQTYTFDYSNFIHNLNACRTNIESLYQKAYA